MIRKYKKILIWSLITVTTSASLATLTYYIYGDKNQTYEIEAPKSISHLNKLKLKKQEFIDKKNEILEKHLFKSDEKFIFYDWKKIKNIEFNYYLVNLYRRSNFKNLRFKNQLSNIFKLDKISDLPLVIFDNYLYSIALEPNLENEEWKEKIKNYLKKFWNKKLNYLYDKKLDSFGITAFADINIKIYSALKEIGLSSILSELDFSNQLISLKKALEDKVNENENLSLNKDYLLKILKIKQILNEDLTNDEKTFLINFKNDIENEIITSYDFDLATMEYIWSVYELLNHYSVENNIFSSIENNSFFQEDKIKQDKYMFLFLNSTFWINKFNLWEENKKLTYLQQNLDSIDFYYNLDSFIAYSYSLFLPFDQNIALSFIKYLFSSFRETQQALSFKNLLNIYFALKILNENDLKISNDIIDRINNLLLNNLNISESYETLIILGCLFQIKHYDIKKKIIVPIKKVAETKQLINNLKQISNIDLAIIFKDLSYFLDLKINWENILKNDDFRNLYYFLFDIIPNENKKQEYSQETKSG
ncbi:Uncharacterised protein [Mycoplasmopsis gallopavonis]|uniref:Uncharacterized protein n=1 Tax=Mycoplasmopsis gallopavonis TaxID=76629 RepID=A0A449AYL4_9BACT|nr:hypothetical protein [Mycoplasmopsis gallopavonis]VEU72639.1 Uncharacterised protein [Mycoplasmopsis gallopavonis]